MCIFSVVQPRRRLPTPTRDFALTRSTEGFPWDRRRRRHISRRGTCPPPLPHFWEWRGHGRGHRGRTCNYHKLL